MGAPDDRIKTLGPNALANGRVRRSLKPGVAGTLRWLRTYGDALICVRHREDPAGLRRMVTVEIVVAALPNAPSPSAGLAATAYYAVRVAPDARNLQRTMRALGGRWHAADGVWYVPGQALREAGLLDLVAYCRWPKGKSRPDAKPSNPASPGETHKQARSRRG
jgi:hypothetical protein